MPNIKMCQYKKEACSLKFLQIYVHTHISHTEWASYLQQLFLEMYIKGILFAMLPQPFLSICAQKLFQCLQTQNYLFIKVNDCVLLSYRVRVSEWIYTLQLPECQGTPRSKQFKWQQQDSIPPGCESESRCCHINVNLSYVYYLS